MHKFWIVYPIFLSSPVRPSNKEVRIKLIFRAKFPKDRFPAYLARTIQSTHWKVWRKRIQDLSETFNLHLLILSHQTILDWPTSVRVARLQDLFPTLLHVFSNPVQLQLQEVHQVAVAAATAEVNTALEAVWPNASTSALQRKKFTMPAKLLARSVVHKPFSASLCL